MWCFGYTVCDVLASRLNAVRVIRCTSDLLVTLFSSPGCEVTVAAVKFYNGYLSKLLHNALKTYSEVKTPIDIGASGWHSIIRLQMVMAIFFFFRIRMNFLMTIFRRANG